MDKKCLLLIKLRMHFFQRHDLKTVLRVLAVWLIIVLSLIASSIFLLTDFSLERTNYWINLDKKSTHNATEVRSCTVASIIHGVDFVDKPSSIATISVMITDDNNVPVDDGDLTPLRIPLVS